MTGDLFPTDVEAALGPRRNIVVGTCSWTDPSLIRAGTFYPKGCSSAEARLRYYASQFPLVEVDSSYYAMPSAHNAALWVQRTPAAFRFNIKAFRLLTGHNTPPQAFPRDMQPLLPPLAGRRKHHYYADLPAELVDELWRRFIEAVAPLRQSGKLSAVHFQFAPFMERSAASVAHVEDCVRRMAGHHLAVEFRNRTWLGSAHAAQTLAWERTLGVTHVVVDEPQGVGNFAHCVWAVANPQLAIVRLHGRNAEVWNAKDLVASSDRFNYEYTVDEIRDLAAKTLALAEQAFAVQVLVNVNHEDQGIRAARRMALALDDLTQRGAVGRTDEISAQGPVSVHAGARPA